MKNKYDNGGIKVFHSSFFINLFSILKMSLWQTKQIIVARSEDDLKIF
jgi:hypothetical protein